MRRHVTLAAVVCAVLLASWALVGCAQDDAGATSGTSGQPPTAATSGSSGQSGPGAYAAKEFVDLVTSKAVSWASDARPYKMESGRPGQDPSIAEGVSGLWRVWFASASKKQMSVFYLQDGQPAMYPEGGGGGFSYETPGLSDVWKIDSVDAVRIAKETGIAEVKSMSLYDTRAEFVTKAREVPESCAAYWDVYGPGADGLDTHVYVDAATGAVYK
ncbi:hypothetical protein MX659_08930 [Coriobacteriia bacterium Es71-Z0120]|uniref:hypothetical protein n=1 Tax=Parvivirga hydrogeniphila TaxID=2939460 RepID=UPI00226093F9|nr:hypothetical protein [Parvivirga hydrogeniphila]MCL4079707.1 hypothetical protein [Parvivirga hydrogeniphila]